MKTVLKILLIEDNPGDARLIQEMLKEAAREKFTLIIARTLAEGQRLLTDQPDVTLVDLGLPDSQGIDTLTRLTRISAGTSFVVLTGLQDENTAMKALRLGAQDYLIKGEINADVLWRVMRYSIERKQNTEALQKSETRYRQLAEQAAVGIGYYDHDGTVQYYNRQALQQLGGKLEDHAGKSLADIFGKRQAAAWLQRFRIAEANPQPQEYEDYVELPTGNKYFVSNYARITDAAGNITGIQVVSLDITEHKLFEEKLRDSEDRYRNLVENVSDVIWNTNRGLVFTYVSAAVINQCGYTPEEVLGRALTDFLTPASQATLKEQLKINEPSTDTRASKTFILEHLCKKGNRIWTEVVANPIYDEQDRLVGYRGISRDITGRKQAEDKNKLTAEIWKLLTLKEDQGKLIADILGLIKNFSGCEAAGIRIREGTDYPYCQSEGFVSGHVEAEDSLCPAGGENCTGAAGTALPVLECLCGNIISGHFDPSKPFFTANGSFYTNCAADFLAADNGENELLCTRKRCMAEGYQSMALIPLKSTGNIIGLLQLNDTRCNLFTPDLIAYYESVGQSIGTVLIQKEAERNLVESEEKYREITEKSLTGISVIQDDRYVYVNNRFAGMHGYEPDEMISQPPWGFIHPEEHETTRQRITGYLDGKATQSAIVKRIRKDGSTFWVEILGSVSNYLGRPAVMGNSVDITDRVRAEAELVLRVEMLDTAADSIFIYEFETGQLIYANRPTYESRGYTYDEVKTKKIFDLITPENLKIIGDRRQNLLKTGGHTFESAHFHKSGTIIPVEVRSRLFERAGTAYVITIARDITERKQALQQLEDSYQKLQKAVSGTIKTIAMTVETRDPYTAGHQGRVAKLAAAIGEAMGFTTEQMAGLSAAGTLHDIGKIHVPAEILSKPGRLNDLEMNLIKTHPQVGSDILKSLELPWDIGTVVRQHHERMDGSGYPAGISGKDIALEARIMAVADVVEAMASHRPYRPALGIEKALEEITKNRGKLYDESCVDACLLLFREKGFKLD